jgi:ABC-2 type transport system permease protein
MGIGLGAAYPDFALENPAQSVTSFGGVFFMIMSAIYIGVVTILEAGPVYAIFMAGLRGHSLSCFQWIWVIGSFSIAFVLSILAIVLPMRFGEKRLRLSAA